ncbi:hypothetical protein [Virgisporangium aurantiacum]|uniref:Uncharacterized protein n=1 Tax=Virgisporangium aurantiacum TaxID=175570 RepID=A0A8J3ZJA2_9ACTN|nr:hypothetical protein [Virgisporangium aurantiacum]GIJ64816.1 hypothetical protein Vau01_123320 [Virgisporangium aurantiacum]
MEYKAVEAAILDAVNAADWKRLSTFGADTVVRLTRDNELLTSVSRHELDSNAWQALNDSCRQSSLRVRPTSVVIWRRSTRAY